MRCPMGYHINDRTSEVHRPGCSHHAEVNCRRLPASITSLSAAVNYARLWIAPEADPCSYCEEREESLRLRRR